MSRGNQYTKMPYGLKVELEVETVLHNRVAIRIAGKLEKDGS